MTLTAIAVGADHSDSLGRAAKAHPANLRKDLVGSQRIRLPNGIFNDRHELALQRAVVALGTPAQPRDHVVRRILDRKVDGHFGSDLDPFWI